MNIYHSLCVRQIMPVTSFSKVAQNDRETLESCRNIWIVHPVLSDPSDTFTSSLFTFFSNLVGIPGYLPRPLPGTHHHSSKSILYIIWELCVDLVSCWFMTWFGLLFSIQFSFYSFRILHFKACYLLLMEYVELVRWNL